MHYAIEYWNSQIGFIGMILKALKPNNVTWRRKGYVNLWKKRSIDSVHTADEGATTYIDCNKPGKDTWGVYFPKDISREGTGEFLFIIIIIILA